MGDGVGEMVVAALVARDAPTVHGPTLVTATFASPKAFSTTCVSGAPEEFIDARAGNDSYVYHGPAAPVSRSLPLIATVRRFRQDISPPLHRVYYILTKPLTSRASVLLWI